jgi:hypothetical protein
VSLTFDAGALIAFERNDRVVLNIVEKAARDRVKIGVPTVVVAQVWRNGKTQSRLARLLRSRVVDIVPLNIDSARHAGQLCGRAETSDIVDAAVVMCARSRGDGVATSDPEDLRRLDPDLRMVVV